MADVRRLAGKKRSLYNPLTGTSPLQTNTQIEHLIVNKKLLSLQDQDRRPLQYRIEMAAGIMQGLGEHLKQKLMIVEKLAESGDMNLQKSQQRTSTLIETPLHAINAAKAMIAGAIDDPKRAADGLREALIKKAIDTREQIMAALHSAHPAHALGVTIGATLGTAITEKMQPSKYIGTSMGCLPDDYAMYASRMGHGLSLPPAKPLRDFSGLMEENYLKSERALAVSYGADDGHTILGVVFGRRLVFSIQAENDRSRYGTGSEIFLSMIRVYHQNGIDINVIDGDWSRDYLHTNYDQFKQLLAEGKNVNQAARGTYTGKMAERLGLTEISNPESLQKAAIRQSNHFYPSFQRPETGWADNHSWQSYRDAFVLGHGRPGLELTAREKLAEKPEETPDLYTAISELNQRQQMDVLEQIHYRLQASDEIIPDMNR